MPPYSARTRVLPVILAALLLVAKAQPDDEALLLAFKDSLDNGGEVLAAWNTSAPLCQWEGVGCNTDGRVQGLNLEGYGLKGPIPSPGGWDLPDTLTDLWFRTNILTGTVPAGWLDRLPAGLSKLDLSDNSLTGSLPVWTSLPSTLSLLSFSGNRFTGSIPRDWRLPDRTEVLTLSGNLLTGGIPVGLKLPPQLTTLDLGRNPLKGTIPPNWPIPDTLQSLSLPSCQLTGTLSPDWRLPESLASLVLSDNDLRGGIDFRLPPDLSVLALMSNRLSGTLNPSWELPKSFMLLTLSFNQLSGPLPSNWTLPPTLFQMALDHNQFTSTIPPWPLPPTLGNIDLSNNRLTGQLPPDWQLNVALRFMSLYNNSLAGTLPAYNSTVQLVVQPGNPGLCGEVPATPQYAVFGGTNNITDISTLPTCPPEYSSSLSSIPQLGGEDESSSGGLSGGAIAGIVVGAVGGAFLALLLFWWIWRKWWGSAGAEPSHSNGKLGTHTSDDLGQETLTTDAARSGGAQATGLLATDPFLSSIVTTLHKRGPASIASSHPRSTSTRTSSTTNDGLSVKGRIDRLEGGVEAWAIDFTELTFTRKVGKGSFGHVYMGMWKQTLVAIKVLTLQQDQEQPDPQTVVSPPRSVVQELRQEATMLAAMRHPNVLPFIAMSLEPPALVLEYCPKGSLAATMHAARAAPDTLPWPVRLKLALGTGLAMLYLHEFDPPIVHRDLRSHNILIGANWTPKVSDFGLSKIVRTDDPSKLSSVPAVTQPRWLAPEVLAGGSHTFASDVYSCGIVLWELLTLDLPFRDFTNPWQVANAVCSGRRPAIPSSDSVPGGSFSGLEEYVSLMGRCWAQSPSERPGFGEVVGVLRRLMSQVLQGAGAPVAGVVGEGPSGTDSGSGESLQAPSAAAAGPRPPGMVLQSVRLAW